MTTSTNVPAGKLIYLAKRNPALSREQFVRRWRRHGALAMQMTFFASIARYSHCDVLAPPQGMRASSEHDALGVVWFRDLTPFPPEEYERMRRDELETFSEYVRNSIVRCTERVLKPGRGLVKVYTFIARRQGSTRAQFAEHWSEVHGPLVLGDADLARHLAGYVQNVVIDDEVTRASKLQFDGVAEFYFHEMADLQRFFADIAKRDAIGQDTGRFLDRERTLFVITNEVMLYDAWDPFAAWG